MELHLGLTISSSSSSASSCSSRYDLNSCDTINHSKKRKHGDDDQDHIPQTLPLLVWNSFCCNKNQLNFDQEKQDQECYDGDDEVQSNSVFVHHRNGIGGVIGWPPVKICRRKVCHPKTNNQDSDDDRDDVFERSKSTYVKVHMEGMGIARKIDLNLHQSYQTLVHSLASMFGKCYEDVKLTYQDKEGDWLLAGDVPWGSFIKTIQRLKLLKK
ncbi:hypothetical protein R6Q57_009810 [Mikania cordata]